MYRTEIPVYSKEDILRTLNQNKYSEEVWNFASDLTGLTIDRLNELADDLNNTKKQNG